jgi:hypothetical protein
VQKKYETLFLTLGVKTVFGVKDLKNGFTEFYANLVDKNLENQENIKLACLKLIRYLNTIQ